MSSVIRGAMSLLLTAALLATTTACYDRTGRTLELTPTDPKAKRSEHIVGLVTTDGEVVAFVGEAEIDGSLVVGQTAAKGKVEIPLERVQRLTIAERKLNTWKTVGLVTGVVVGVAAVGVAVASGGSSSKSSTTSTTVGGCCPFFYSFDGTGFTFDAEPYPGAVTHGLERSGDVVLDRLRPDGDAYRLLMTNERDETEYTDVVSLRVVDHPAGVRIAPGEDGRLHPVSRPLAPVSARTADGRDLLPWLAATDALVYEPEPAVRAEEDPRDEIVLVFPRPPDASRATLVVNVGASVLGSLMLTEFLAMHGRELPAWYEALDGSPAAVAAAYDMIGRNESWALKLDVETPGGWQTVSALLGAGPLVVKDRAVPLDVSRLAGRELRVRVRPPKGYWALNSFAVDYAPGVPLSITEVPLTAARAADGTDRTATLGAADGSYDVLPAGEGPVALSFAVPRASPGLSRTVVLHAKGWYREHVRAEGDPDRETLRRFETEPDFAARLAGERWRMWQGTGRSAGAPEARPAR